MTDRLTDKELDGLEKLHREATAGPWSDQDYGSVTVSVNGFRRQVASFVGDASSPYCPYVSSDQVRDANAALTAAARNALPRLLAEVREGRAFREQIVRSLRAIAMADKTVYEHHEKRRQDGKRPKEDGGTIWNTPRELALGALERLGEETESLYWPFEKPAKAKGEP